MYTTHNHHHTVQVAREQVEYLRQWLEVKTLPVQVAVSDDHRCASGVPYSRKYWWGIHFGELAIFT